MKHAYLIIAHNEPIVLSALLESIDDERNDIFLHIDRRATALREQFQEWKPKHSGFSLLENPIAVCWGDVNQVEVEMKLFRAAFEHAAEHSGYAFYHLLSGVDLPLKSQNEIHAFFQAHAENEFVGFWTSAAHEKDLRRRVGRRYIFTKHLKDKHSLVHKLTTPLRKLFLILQKLVGYRRKWPMEMKKGPNWVSITGAFCAYLLEREEEILRSFRYVLAPDEIFLQSIIYNSPFKDKIFDLQDDNRGTMRLIDWQRGTPYAWSTADIPEMLASPYFFARKISAERFDVQAFKKSVLCKQE